MRTFLFSYRPVILSFLAGVVCALCVVVYRQDKGRTVAEVNGEAIPWRLFLNRAIHVCGDDVITMLADETLVEQEMKKRNMSVPLAEIKERANAYRSNFPDDKKYNEWAEKHYLKEEDLWAQAKLDIGLEKLVAATVDEGEMKKYYERTKAHYKTKDGKVLSFDEAKPQIAQIFVQEKKKSFLEKLRENVRLEKFPLQIPLVGNN